MKVSVDKELCIGCGNCESIDPELFRLGDQSYSEVLLNPVPEDHHDNARQAADECPALAIMVEDDMPCGEEVQVTTPAKDADDETFLSNLDPKKEENKMKVVVDKDLCIGCGICEGIAPEVFSLATEPYAVVVMNPIAEEMQDAVREAAEDCPEAAILIEE